jgi:uracil-DNA glycosylase
MKQELVKLYSEIHNCHICPKMDKFKLQRNIESVDENSSVFILSQALAERQLRKSGVNFFKEDGTVGDTGRLLEKFLNQFDQTIYPPREIILANGTKVPKCANKYKSVYNTEITQCYPGKGKVKGDRVPDKNEIQSCIDSNFLLNEIQIIQPKLMLLMGRASTQTFFRYILKIENKLTLTDLINQIISKNEIPKTNIFGNEIAYVPIQHASGANPSFGKMCNNEKLIALIKNYLD